MLNDSQIATFKEEGYLIIENLFTEDDLRPVKDEFSAVVEAQAQQLYQAGRVSALYENESFERRLAKITAEAPEAASALQTRVHKDEGLFQFMKHPKILDRVESLVGPDILCHPSYNIHPRLPGRYTTPHQDAGFYLPDGDETLILACLIPLVDTTPENGCLWVAPRRHKEGVLRHLWEEDGLNISLEEVSEAERQPVPYKGRQHGDVQQYDPARFAGQSHGYHPLEYGPALPSTRETDRTLVCPRLCRPESLESRLGDTQLQGMDHRS